MAQVGRALNPHLYLSSSSPRFPSTLVSSTRPQLPPLPKLISTKTPRSLNITLAHKHIHTTPSALVLDAPPAVSSSSSSDEEEVAEKQEEEGVWKYPFSDIVVKKRRKLFDREWTTRDVVKASIGVAMHALCLLAPFTFTWGAFTVAMTLIVFTGLGITLSYHRNLSHRSFKLPQWLEYFWAYCGTHALQGSPMTWVSIHRTHHLHTDKEGDPHSPIEGFWFSQINWIFDTEYFHTKQGGALSNVGDMDKQPFYRFIEDTYIAHPIALAALLYAVGGLPWLVWGMGVRSVLTTHGTYLVNSGLHIWGSRAYNTDDNSHNNWIMAFFTFGEGWHNNHHAFEYSARHGFEWWEIDVTWYVIKMLDSLGLVKDIKLPTEAQKKKMLERWG